jgi:hypothetical protein
MDDDNGDDDGVDATILLDHNKNKENSKKEKSLSAIEDIKQTN